MLPYLRKSCPSQPCGFLVYEKLLFSLLSKTPNHSLFSPTDIHNLVVDVRNDVELLVAEAGSALDFPALSQHLLQTADERQRSVDEVDGARLVPVDVALVRPVLTCDCAVLSTMGFFRGFTPIAEITRILFKNFNDNSEHYA